MMMSSRWSRRSKTRCRIICHVGVILILLSYSGTLLFLSTGWQAKIANLLQQTVLQDDGIPTMVQKQQHNNSLRRFDKSLQRGENQRAQGADDAETHVFQHIPILELPCPTFEGSLFLHSALITKGHYEEEVYVDIFGIAEDYFTPNHKKYKKQGNNKWAEISKRPGGQDLQGLLETLDNAPEKWDPPLQCLVSNPEGQVYTVPVIFIPRSASVDGNVNGHTHIMRCKITDFIQPSLLHQIGEVSVLLTRRECSADDINVEGCAVIARINIPLPSGITGQFSTPGTFGNYEKKPIEMVNVTLCAPGATSANLLFLEFVEHHHMIGFNHIHIGVHAPWEHKTMKKFQALLWPAISNGYVTLHSTWMDGLDFGDEGKQFFMHICLYHSKRMARWSGVWDFDEFVTPHTPNTNIMDIIDQQDNFGKKEICWIQFSSFSVVTQNKTAKAQKSIWPTEHFLKKDPSNEHWKKSIANTERCFTSGYHLPGTCNHSSPKIAFDKRIRQERQDYTDFVAKVDPKIAGMHHYVNAFKQRYRPKKEQTEDEFGKYYFPRILERIKVIDPDFLQWEKRVVQV